MSPIVILIIVMLALISNTSGYTTKLFKNLIRRPNLITKIATSSPSFSTRLYATTDSKPEQKNKKEKLKK